MRKKKVCCSIIIISLLLCSCTSQKTEKVENAEVTAENTESESINNEKIEDGEKEGGKLMKFISVERFMEIYKLSLEDIGDFNLQGMITEDQVTEENIDDYDWKARLELYIADGINFGYDVSQMVFGKGRHAKVEDDITSVKWMVMDNSDGLYRQIFIWDINNKKSYFSQANILYDYSKADIIKELTEEQVNQMVLGLVTMNMPEWESYYGGGESDEEDYYWDLFVVLENGDVLFYRGCQPEISAPEGFYDWLQEVIRVSKGE